MISWMIPSPFDPAEHVVLHVFIMNEVVYSFDADSPFSTALWRSVF